MEFLYPSVGGLTGFDCMLSRHTGGYPVQYRVDVSPSSISFVVTEFYVWGLVFNIPFDATKRPRLNDRSSKSSLEDTHLEVPLTVVLIPRPLPVITTYSKPEGS